MRVFVHNKKNKSGTITFEYNELGQLDRLVDIIKKNYQKFKTKSETKFREFVEFFFTILSKSLIL